MWPKKNKEGICCLCLLSALALLRLLGHRDAVWELPTCFVGLIQFTQTEEEAESPPAGSELAPWFLSLNLRPEGK